MKSRILRALLPVLVGCAVLTSAAGEARAALIVVPNGLENVEGNLSNAFPFNTGTLLPQRYQQVYSSSNFSSFDGPLRITAIAFRPERNEGAFSVTLPDIQINLSTTTRQPDSLSKLFSSNVGADDAVVFGRASLALSSAATGSPQGPKDFDIVIDLENPFFYDPSVESLLLDVRNFEGRNLGISFDAEATFGDAVSRVFTNGDIPEGVSSPVGVTDAIGTLGLVTRFTVARVATVVLEPSTLVLLSLGMLIAGCFLWKSNLCPPSI